jgi:coenzyme F420 biosynthesis associated uncharacterized protein
MDSMDGTTRNPAHSADRFATRPAAPGLINWDLAAATAARLTPAGPLLSGRQIGLAVEELRILADRSVPHVHDITRLEAARDLRDSQVLIVDRASWAKANTQSFEVLLQPALQKLAAKQATMSPSSAAVGGTITGAQLGAVLAFLSSKVLGQYDPFAAMASPGSAGFAGGRLLLVAPNIISVERELNVEPADFRLWVCLHEQTHRVQFAAAPWLRHHMLSEIEKLSGLLMNDAENLGDRIASAARALAAGKSPARSDGPSRGGVLDLLQDPEEKAALSHLTAVMSLLEGHASVVMDAVDARIVPSVVTIRQRFNSRGKDRGAIEKFLRNVLGLDAKMRQYSDGARFVRAVVAGVGMEGFNRVWEGAGHLPTEAEIHAPRQWIERMGL